MASDTEHKFHPRAWICKVSFDHELEGCAAQQTCAKPPALWGCKAHWFKLPKRLRDAIWRASPPPKRDWRYRLRYRLRRAWASRPWFWDGWIGLMPFHDTKAHQRWKAQGFYDAE